MAAIDPNQAADKLMVQRASACAVFKGAAVRFADGKIGLCTSTYNHSQDAASNAEIARRVAALWNLSVGIPTAELEALDASSFKLRK